MICKFLNFKLITSRSYAVEAITTTTELETYENLLSKLVLLGLIVLVLVSYKQALGDYSTETVGSITEVLHIA